MRTKLESPEVNQKICKNFGPLIKIVVMMARAELKKETEDGLLLDILKKLMVQISGQNTDNIGKKKSRPKRLRQKYLALKLEQHV